MTESSARDRPTNSTAASTDCGAAADWSTRQFSIEGRVNAPAKGATRAPRWRPSISTGRVVVALLICASLAALASGNLRFLDDSTSWQLGFSTFPQQPIDPYWKTIAISVANTLMLAAVAIVVSTIVG